MEAMSCQTTRGYLKLYLGPMFAGKTSAIVQNYRRYTHAKKRVIVINHSLDKRYSKTHLSTHDGIEIPCIFTSSLSLLNLSVEIEYDIILINEGQFFPDLVDTVLNWTENMNKAVYVCGLDGDSNRQPFGEILRLLPYADDYEKLTSICELCGKSAPFTYRNPETSNGETIQIGVNEFKPLCRVCFIEQSLQHKTYTVQREK